MLSASDGGTEELLGCDDCIADCQKVLSRGFDCCEELIGG